MSNAKKARQILFPLIVSIKTDRVTVVSLHLDLDAYDR
jgi:hypothetical protein